MYAMKQNKSLVSEYYSRVRVIWEELDAMSELLVLSTIFLNVLKKQWEEQKLFKFLNGLDKDFGPKRS